MQRSNITLCYYDPRHSTDKWTCRKNLFNYNRNSQMSEIKMQPCTKFGSYVSSITTVQYDYSFYFQRKPFGILELTNFTIFILPEKCFFIIIFTIMHFMAAHILAYTGDNYICLYILYNMYSTDTMTHLYTNIMLERHFICNQLNLLHGHIKWRINLFQDTKEHTYIHTVWFLEIQ